MFLSRQDHSPTGVELAHADEHVEDEGGEIGLVHDGLTRRHQAPLELRDVLQGSPPVHALRPAPRLRIDGAVRPKLLHLGEERHHSVEVVKPLTHNIAVLDSSKPSTQI